MTDVELGGALADRLCGVRTDCGVPCIIKPPQTKWRVFWLYAFGGGYKDPSYRTVHYCRAVSGEVIVGVTHMRVICRQLYARFHPDTWARQDNLCWPSFHLHAHTVMCAEGAFWAEYFLETKQERLSAFMSLMST